MTAPAYRLEFSPSAERDLEAILEWISEASGYPDRAVDYVTRIQKFCDDLVVFPKRFAPADDIASGLRIAGFERRATIAYLVDDAGGRVIIVGIFAAGRDVDALLAKRASSS